MTFSGRKLALPGFRDKREQSNRRLWNSRKTFTAKMIKTATKQQSKKYLRFPFQLSIIWVRRVLVSSLTWWIMDYDYRVLEIETNQRDCKVFSINCNITHSFVVSWSLLNTEGMLRAHFSTGNRTHSNLSLHIELTLAPPTLVATLA